MLVAAVSNEHVSASSPRQHRSPAPTLLKWHSGLTLFFGFLQKAIEDPVDEGGLLGGAEAFGQLNGLVDGDAIGRVGVEDLVGPQAEDVTDILTSNPVVTGDSILYLCKTY